MTVLNSFRDLEQIRREIDQVFNTFWPVNGGSPWRLAFLPGQEARRYPRINLYEDSEGYVAEALAPGIDPDKLDVSVEGHTLTISGEKLKSNGDLKPEDIHRSERSAGRFVRSIELPGEVDVDKVEAGYKHGILMIKLPKTEQAKPRRIEVQVLN